MTAEPVLEICPAYRALERKFIAKGAALSLDDVEAVLANYPETQAVFVQISRELDAGCGLDDELISERVRMPRPFIRVLIAALRHELAVESVRPAGTVMQ